MLLSPNLHCAALVSSTRTKLLGQQDLLGEACHGNCCVDAMGHLPLPHPAPLLQARACVNCLPSVGLRMVSAIAPVLHPAPPAIDVNAHVGHRHMLTQCTIPGCQARKVHTPASMVFSMHALQIRATSGVESVASCQSRWLNGGQIAVASSGARNL